MMADIELRKDAGAGGAVRLSLSGLPDHAQRILQEAADTLSALPDESRKRMFDAFAQSIDEVMSYSSSRFANDSGVSPQHAIPVYTFLHIVLTVALDQGCDPKLVLSEAESVGLVQKGTAAKTNPLLEYFFGKVDLILSKMDEQRLAGISLPNFTGVSIAVDLRVNVRDGQMKTSVPVAIIRTITDEGPSGPGFQIARSSLEFFIRQLQAARNKMATLEKLRSKLRA